MIDMKICTHKGSCFHCKENCCGAGDIGADCPKWKCDRPEGSTLDCEKCAFIKHYIKDVYGEEV